MEKSYFGLCTMSAASGLPRAAAGDQVFHAGLYIRVARLSAAVAVGLSIVRRHSSSNSESNKAEAGNSQSSSRDYQAERF